MHNMEKRKLLNIGEELKRDLHEYAVRFHDGNESAAIRYLLRIGLDAEMSLRYPKMVLNTETGEITTVARNTGDEP